MKSKIKYLFIIVWLISTVLFSINIFGDFFIIRYIKLINVIYVISLLAFIYLPKSSEKFNCATEEIIKIKYLKLWELVAVTVFISGLIIYAGMKSSTFLVLFPVSLIISIYILYKLRWEISKSILIIGFVVGIITTLYSYSVSDNLISIIVFPIVTTFYVAGSLLNKKYLLTTVQINGLFYLKVLKSFFIGALLAIPMSLSNLSDVLITRPDAKWISGIWQSSLAFPAGIFEETWFRLLVLTFLYAIISPKIKKQFIPVILALLVSSFLHGIGHYPGIDLQNCINISLFYSLPLGVLFIWRDFETAVGYHFMIDFVRVIGGLLIST